MKFNKKIILGVMCCFLAIFFISCADISKDEVIHQINLGNYQQALDDMQGLSANERVEVQNVAVNKIPYIVKMVDDKKLTNSQAVDELNFIKRIIPKNEEYKADKAIDYIKGLDYQNNMQNKNL